MVWPLAKWRRPASNLPKMAAPMPFRTLLEIGSSVCPVLLPVPEWHLPGCCGWEPPWQRPRGGSTAGCPAPASGSGGNGRAWPPALQATAPSGICPTGPLQTGAQPRRGRGSSGVSRRTRTSRGAWSRCPRSCPRPSSAGRSSRRRRHRSKSGSSSSAGCSPKGALCVGGAIKFPEPRPCLVSAGRGWTPAFPVRGLRAFPDTWALSPTPLRWAKGGP